MPRIRYMCDETTGFMGLYVGKERITGIKDVELDFNLESDSPVIAKITAIIGGEDEEEIKTEPGKFAFKEGISNDSIQ